MIDWLIDWLIDCLLIWNEGLKISELYKFHYIYGRDYNITTGWNIILFDFVVGLSGGSGSEIDTEDELELARKAQGERHEAAGEDSDGHSRPGNVCSLLNNVFTVLQLQQKDNTVTLEIVLRVLS